MFPSCGRTACGSHPGNSSTEPGAGDRQMSSSPAPLLVPLTESALSPALVEMLENLRTNPGAGFCSSVHERPSVELPASTYTTPDTCEEPCVCAEFQLPASLMFAHPSRMLTRIRVSAWRWARPARMAAPNRATLSATELCSDARAAWHPIRCPNSADVGPEASNRSVAECQPTSCGQCAQISAAVRRLPCVSVHGAVCVVDQSAPPTFERTTLSLAADAVRRARMQRRSAATCPSFPTASTQSGVVCSAWMRLGAAPRAAAAKPSDISYTGARRQRQRQRWQRRRRRRRQRQRQRQRRRQVTSASRLPRAESNTSTGDWREAPGGHTSKSGAVNATNATATAVIATPRPAIVRVAGTAAMGPARLLCIVALAAPARQGVCWVEVKRSWHHRRRPIEQSSCSSGPV
jgi:hypothetical protein